MAVTYVQRECEQCSKIFKVRASILLHKPCKFCSKECAYERLSEIKTGKTPMYCFGKKTNKK